MNIRKRGDRWQAQVYVDGHRRARTFDTKSLAQKWARSIETARDSGEDVKAPSRVTVAGYYTGLAGQRRAVLASATTAKDNCSWRNYIEPAFGGRQIVEVRRSDIQSWVSAQVDAGVGVPTLENAMKLLGVIFGQAVSDDLIVASPVSRVALPRHQAREVRWIGREEVAGVVVHLHQPYALLVDLAAYTGLRWGEIAGLRVGAVDPFGRTLTVRTVLEKDGTIRDYPKSDSSIRTVAIPDRLRSSVLAQLTDKSRHDLVFAGPRGGGLSDRNVAQRHLLPASSPPASSRSPSTVSGTPSSAGWWPAGCRCSRSPGWPATPRRS